MSDNKVSGLMDTTLEKIKGMVDVNTSIGTPINTDDGTVILPVNKVSYGFGGGGSDIPSKHSSTLFGGGSGGAVTITPIAFLVIKNGDVKAIQIEPFNNSIDRLIQNIPDLIDKLSALIKKEENIEEVAE